MIRVDIREKPGKLSYIARAKSADWGVGEVYIRGALNIEHAQNLAELGHDPLEVPPEVKAMGRAFVRQGALSFDPDIAKRSLTAAAQYTAKWLRQRIISGALGTMSPVTIKIKLWLIEHGRATSAYGSPGPYGISTGHLVHNILARWRPGRG